MDFCPTQKNIWSNSICDLGGTQTYNVLVFRVWLAKANILKNGERAWVSLSSRRQNPERPGCWILEDLQTPNIPTKKETRGLDTNTGYFFLSLVDTYLLSRTFWSKGKNPGKSQAWFCKHWQDCIWKHISCKAESLLNQSFITFCVNIRYQTTNTCTSTKEKGRIVLSLCFNCEHACPTSGSITVGMIVSSVNIGWMVTLRTAHIPHCRYMYCHNKNTVPSITPKNVRRITVTLAISLAGCGSLLIFLIEYWSFILMCLDFNSYFYIYLLYIFFGRLNLLVRGIEQFLLSLAISTFIHFNDF